MRNTRVDAAGVDQATRLWAMLSLPLLRSRLSPRHILFQAKHRGVLSRD